MAEQQALNATFFAFRKRENGGVLLGASIAFAVVMLVFTIAFGAAVFAMLGGMDFVHWYSDVMSSVAKGGTPAASAPPNVGGLFLIFPLEMIFLFFVAVLLAAFESSCLRWMIRGERSKPFNLCFGADMWRVYATYWVWFLYFLCTGVLFWIVMLVFALIGGAAGGKDNPAVAGLVVGVACIAWILGWIYVAVRLAPAAATSIGVGHFAPLKAWSVSRGRFWALLGSYLLLMLLYVVAVIVVGGIAMGPFYASVFSHVDWSVAQTDPAAFSRSYQSANMQALQSLFASPVTIALYVGGQIAVYAVGLVFYVLFYGVNARAVQAALEDGKIEHAPAS
jgi:hypothetical protein